MASKGQNELEVIVRELLPMETLTKEHHIGEKLRLDLFYPKYNIAFEYHGRQHFEYVEHFHGDIYGFQDAMTRDIRKAQLCEEHGIVLLVFRYDEKLDQEMVGARIHEAIINSEKVEPPKPKRRSWPKADKESPYHKELNERRRKYAQENYQRMKELKKKD